MTIINVIITAIKTIITKLTSKARKILNIMASNKSIKFNKLTTAKAEKAQNNMNKVAKKKGRPVGSKNKKTQKQKVEQEMAFHIMEVSSAETLSRANGIFNKTPKSYRTKYRETMKSRSRKIALLLAYSVKVKFIQFCILNNLNARTGFLALAGMKYNSEAMCELEWSFNRQGDALRRSGTAGVDRKMLPEGEKRALFTVLDFSGKLYEKAWKKIEKIAFGVHNREIGSWASQLIEDTMKDWKPSKLMSVEEIAAAHESFENFTGFDSSKDARKIRATVATPKVRVVSMKDNKKAAAKATKLGRNLAKRQDKIQNSKQGWNIKPSYIFTANDAIRMAMMQNAMQESAKAARKS